MKKLILGLAFAFGISAIALADAYNYLNLISTSTVQSAARTSVKKITFEGTQAIVTLTDGSKLSAPLATLSALTFTDTALGVSDLREDGTITYERGCVVTSGSGWLQIYNASGQLIRQQRMAGGRGELSLDGLTHGIFIAKFGHKTIKFLH